MKQILLLSSGSADVASIKGHRSFYHWFWDIIGSLFDFHSGLSRLVSSRTCYTSVVDLFVAGSRVDIKREWGEDGSF